jgi:hypothetical protein
MSQPRQSGHLATILTGYAGYVSNVEVGVIGKINLR